MVLFANIDQNAQDAMLDDNGVDDVVFLSIQNHNIEYLNEVEMFGLDFGGFF